MKQGWKCQFMVQMDMESLTRKHSWTLVSQKQACSSSSKIFMKYFTIMIKIWTLRNGGMWDDDDDVLNDHDQEPLSSLDGDSDLYNVFS